MAREERILKRYDNNTFRPHQQISQAELLKLTYEVFGIDVPDYFRDDLAQFWYDRYIRYGKENNFFSGISV